MSINGLNDSHKRTDISQLLNPGPAHREPAPSYPSPELATMGQQQVHHDQQSSQYNPTFAHPSSFHLRAANWEIQEDANKRRQQDDNPTRPYHHPQMEQVFYPDHASRPSRPRPVDPHNFGVDGNMWGPAHDMTNMSYNPPQLMHMYSEERTVLSGDYAPANQYPHYQDPSHPNMSSSNASGWQMAERASVRIAARESAVQIQPTQQQPRYPLPLYYNMPFAPAPVEAVAPPPPKRPAEPVEDLPAPKAKKAKTKAKTNADGTAGSSKRGYNAKKRSEAAQIAAQNAQLMPTVSYTQMPNEKGKDQNADARIVSKDNPPPPGTDASGPLQPELQFARCMSNRYRSENFPRCVSCTRRWAGDTCRFQGIRFFLKDPQRNIVGISFVETQKADAPTMAFPNKWNVPLQPLHIRRTKRTIASALLPTLQAEFEHLNKPEIIRRPRESDVRATCDTCMTSIFSSSWMCRLCGREACAECFQQVKELTQDRPGANQQEVANLQARREKHAHSNPFFLSCTRRNEHRATDFSPMSRFCKVELTKAISEMEALLREPDIDAIPVLDDILDPSLNGHIHTSFVGGSSSSSPTNPPDMSLSNTNTDSSGVNTPPELALAMPMNFKSLAGMNPQTNPHFGSIVSDSSAGGVLGELPSHVTQRFTDAELTDDVFRRVWAKGRPLVVTGLLSKFKIQWTPEYFIEKYRPQPCLIIECQTDTNKKVTVGDFFALFGQYEGRTDCWKLKDWPPSVDFKMAFPELYEDFSNAVPVPSCVRRDGALNIASHFPSNTVAPDLGPKMYNAMASFQTSGSKGSTRLHMDMADAMNIMTYATPTPDGHPGCAAWDLFRAEDSDHIRAFLRKKYQGLFQNDPIHAQQFYLDFDLRRELFETYGVKSHRVYQRPGEAVFIPAGCAHQVANLADCIKVAVDFVSPENIIRCEKLTREFREQNQSMVWKEDVLQLRTMMWFAWLSCCRQES